MVLNGPYSDKDTPWRTFNIWKLKVARYSFSRPIPPKFEHKLRRHKQSFGKIATTVVLDKDENLFLGTGNCSSKIIQGSFFLQ